MNLCRRCLAEAFGTFWLTFAGCGAIVLAAAFPHLGVGFVGIALAFGIAQLTMCYMIGHISGSHINPAVTCGLVAGGRFPVRELIPYIVAQVIGAIIAGAAVYAIASGKAGFNMSANFATNGYGSLSPGGYSLEAAGLLEFILAVFFVMIFMGATDKHGTRAFFGVSIGLALALIYLVSLPVTGGSVNPARSTGPAIFQGGWALSQIWLFWIAPIVGGIIGGLIYRYLWPSHKQPEYAESGGWGQ